MELLAILLATDPGPSVAHKKDLEGNLPLHNLGKSGLANSFFPDQEVCLKMVQALVDASPGLLGEKNNEGQLD